jgi:hypothetical protein
LPETVINLEPNKLKNSPTTTEELVPESSPTKKNHDNAARKTAETRTISFVEQLKQMEQDLVKAKAVAKKQRTFQIQEMERKRRRDTDSDGSEQKTSQHERRSTERPIVGQFTERLSQNIDTPFLGG